MADAKTINGYNVKDAAAREAIANLDTVKLASEGGASGSIRFGVDSQGNYGYYKAGADTVTPFKEGDGSSSRFMLYFKAGSSTSLYCTVYDRKLGTQSTKTFTLEMGIADLIENGVTIGQVMLDAVDWYFLPDFGLTFYYNNIQLISSNFSASLSDTTNSYIILADTDEPTLFLPNNTRLIKSGSGTTSFTFNKDYDLLCIIAWGGGNVATYVKLDGTNLKQLGLNNYYETVALCYGYIAGQRISVATDPSGYRVYEVYRG